MKKRGRKSLALKEMMNEQRINIKMKLRKQKIQEAISQSRMKGTNPIVGYNLSAHKKMYIFQI